MGSNVTPGTGQRYQLTRAQAAGLVLGKVGFLLSSQVDLVKACQHRLHMGEERAAHSQQIDVDNDKAGDRKADQHMQVCNQESQANLNPADVFTGCSAKILKMRDDQEADNPKTSLAAPSRGRLDSNRNRTKAFIIKTLTSQ